MSFKYSFFKGRLAGLAALIFFSACKENTVLPAGLVPAVDNITVFGTDTMSILAKTVYDDSAITSAFASGLNVYVGAGKIDNDVFFGKTQSEFYFQVRPPQDNFTFDRNSLQADSAVLVLPYSGFAFGDTSFSAGYQQFEVYRTLERIYFDSTYYSFSRPPSEEATPIAQRSVYLPELLRSIYDSTRVGGVNRAPHLRFRLSDAVLDDLVRNAGTDKYTNTANFLLFFNGLHVKVSGSGNTISYFRLNGDDNFSRAGILLYYHTLRAGGVITDTLIHSFPYDPTASQTKTAYFSRVTRDYSGTPAQSILSSGSGNQLLIQNQPGAALDIEMPFVKNLPPCLVNKAELVITQISSPMDKTFAAPTRLYPLSLDERGGKSPLADRYPLSSTSPLVFIDGYLRVANIGGLLVNQYVINFPKEMQDAVVGKKKSLRLHITGTQTFPGAYRLVAGGSQYSLPDYKMKVNVVYTKL